MDVALLWEFARRGIKNVTIWMPPPPPNATTTHLEQYVHEVADKLEPVAMSCSCEAKVLIDGYTYTVHPSPGIGNVIFVRSL